jgi:hypothetical protein
VSPSLEPELDDADVEEFDALDTEFMADVEQGGGGRGSGICGGGGGRE